MAHSDSSPFPVAVVEKLLRVGDHDRKLQLFRWVLSTKKGMKIRRDLISYSQAAELIEAKQQ